MQEWVAWKLTPTTAGMPPEVEGRVYLALLLTTVLEGFSLNSFTPLPGYF